VWLSRSVNDIVKISVDVDGGEEGDEPPLNGCLDEHLVDVICVDYHHCMQCHSPFRRLR
jgi:hypothetical protein